MSLHKVSKEDFEKFLSHVSKDFELYAPLKKGLVRYHKINDSNIKNIYLEKNSYFPVKEFFFSKRDVLFKFKDNKIESPKLETPSKVFFGLRRCDLNGIKHQDMIFNGQIKDPYYIAARQNSYLIGFHCWEAPSKYCFCGTLKLADFYDLIVYDKKDHYLVEVGSDKGTSLIHKYNNLFHSTDVILTKEDKKIKNADRLLKDDIKGSYDNPKWQEGVNKCLSCAACTALCPTCYCFEIHDETKTANTKEGERIRQWSSCQLQEFTRVAGDHVFRQKREERFKHRIYHQLQYFKDRYGVNLCVGCGRCIEGCPTRIDFVEIINEMK